MEQVDGKKLQLGYGTAQRSTGQREKRSWREKGCRLTRAGIRGKGLSCELAQIRLTLRKGEEWSVLSNTGRETRTRTKGERRQDAEHGSRMCIWACWGALRMMEAEQVSVILGP